MMVEVIYEIKEENRKYYIVCEWIVQNNEYTHKNYGAMEKDFTAAFTYIVENDILTCVGEEIQEYSL